MSNREELIKQYILDGGEIFSVKKINSYRDGGTKIIELSDGRSFYIDKDMQDLYSDYPLKTRVLDLRFQAMLLERMEKYLSVLEWDVRTVKSMINFLEEY